jgi:CelD/BcsL family acetyltransferase involved in cellulose biosynthesis
VSEISSEQSQNVRLQIVESVEGISEFGGQWDDLFARAVDAPPFLSRPWVVTFVEEGRISGTPVFILAWDGTTLVALLPLAVRECMNVKVAVPIGTGQGSYLGLLLDPDYPSAVETMVDRIVSEKIFDVYCSTDLYSEDPATNELLDHLVRKNYSCRRVYRNPCPCIRLGCSYEEYLERTKSAKSRQTLRRKERQLHKKYAVNVEYYQGDEATSTTINRIASIQKESWMKRRGAAILGQSFYRKLLLTMSEAGLGRVWIMTIDGADAAFVYALVAHRRLYYAWTAFKLEYASSFSIGQFLTNWTIHDACGDGILLYDFEHGDADYKRFWSTDNYSVYRVVAGRGICGNFIVGFYFVVWRLSRIKWLKYYYRGMRRKIRGLKQETVTSSSSR